ncbi:MAG TPA: acyl carrier protein [Candidatus Babeliales bacterium]|nr:acyl carrier protein [Candidatus Babeliales bacterium]
MPTFDMQDTLEKIITIIAQELKIEKTVVTHDVTLESLGADSIDIVQIIMRLEEQFGIEINDEDAEKMQSLSDIAAYVQARRTK